MKIVNLISCISIPIYLIIFIAADAIVSILYGHEYIEVAFLLRILSFYGIECSIDSQGNILQISLGRTDIGFKWTIVRIICSIFVIVAVSQINITAVAYGQLVLSIISIYLFWWIVIKPLIKLNFITYIKSFFGPLLIGAAITIPLFCVSQFITLYWWQIPLAICFLSAYVIYYMFFKKDYIIKVLKLIKNKEV